MSLYKVIYQGELLYGRLLLPVIGLMALMLVPRNIWVVWELNNGLVPFLHTCNKDENGYFFDNFQFHQPRV